jgi:outer membrane protein OmpA-like peptidoglycan-associated protein
MSSEYIVLGEFKGRFKTNQSQSIGLTDNFPIDFAHKVQVFEGSLDNTSFESEYTPEKFRKLSSFVLSNVPNIMINGNSSGPFPDKRVYTFTQLIIIDPKIDRTYEMNGLTYGEMSGKAYGISEKNPQIERLDPDPIQNKGNDSGGSVGSSDFNENSEIGQAFNNAQNGCINAVNGCLENFWRILMWILLILFLLWLIRACNRLAQDDGVCDRKEKHEILLEKEKKERDSLELIYKENLRKALVNMKNIYFYQNTTDFHDYSIGSQGNLNRLTNLLKICNDKPFYIIGYHSGKTIENTNLDSLRAMAVKSHFISNGIKESNIILLRKGQVKTDSTNELYPFLTSDYGIKYYNRNMRVEIKLKD